MDTALVAPANQEITVAANPPRAITKVNATEIATTNSTVGPPFSPVIAYNPFSSGKEKVMEFVVFAVIAVCGLVITEALMWTFTEKLGWYYMISKAVAAIIVLFWNFFMKKILLYKKKK